MKLTFGIAILALLSISVTSAGKRKKLRDQIADLTKAVQQLSQKQGNGPWQKLNTAPVCFGAKDSQFGTFKVPSGGNIRQMKLVHLYGYVNCQNGVSINYWSPFSCSIYPGLTEYIGVTITTASNDVLLPPKEMSIASGWSFIPGFNGRSRKIVLTKFADPISVTSGQELRLWYSEDLVNGPEGDNAGTSCCDVYAMFE
ncbi:uncharacterized protein LOC144666449 [Oculina patagonica]